MRASTATGASTTKLSRGLTTLGHLVSLVQTIIGPVQARIDADDQVTSCLQRDSKLQCTSGCFK